MKTQRKHQFKFLNEHPNVSKNCIYAVNHSCKWDFQYMVEIAQKHFYVLAGKQRLKFIDKLAFVWNEAIWVDRMQKNSKKASKQKMEKVLKRGKSLCIFPEGTWNLELSQPMLPLYWGTVEIAQRTSTPIVPVCLEYIGGTYIVKYGTLIYVVADEDKSQVTLKLRDVLATLKWDTWSMSSITKRCDIHTDYWNTEIQRRLDEYKLLDYEYEMSCIRNQR